MTASEEFDIRKRMYHLETVLTWVKKSLQGELYTHEEVICEIDMALRMEKAADDE